MLAPKADGSRHRDKQGLVACRELAWGPWSRRLLECQIQTVLDETLLGPVHGRGPYPDVTCDGLVGGPDVGGEQNLRPLELAHGALATTHKGLKLLSFLGRQGHAIAYVHGNLGSNRRSRVQ